MSKFLFTNNVQAHNSTYSIFFGSMKTWPWWIKNGWWPADLLLTLLFGLLLSLFLFKGFVNNAPDSRITPLYVIGYLSVIGVFMGVMVTRSFGWYKGIEAYCLGTAFEIALILLFGTVWGIGWCIWKAFRRPANASVEWLEGLRPIRAIHNYFNEDEYGPE